MCLFLRVAILLLTLQSLVIAECPGVVSRITWNAANPVRVQYLTPPVNIVIIQHTVNETCSNDADCEGIMRAIQNHYIDNLNYWDIGSSFYVGGNGKIYEGVGWLHVGAHTYGYNSNSIGISFIGNYNDVTPTNAQLDAVKGLLRCGVEEGHLTQDYHVVGHKQLISTESPGRKLYSAIRRWPEWLENVGSIKMSRWEKVTKLSLAFLSKIYF